MAQFPSSPHTELTVVGGGLAGSEAAWQAAQRGVRVHLYEMRPLQQTGAHTTGDLAEIICSNSLGSTLPDRASGLLKQELSQLGCLLLECAAASALPAGGALAVDRAAFSALVSRRIQSHPLITVIRQEVTDVPASPAIIASGPLTSPALAHSIEQLNGLNHLFFFDAIAPIIEADSIDFSIAYRGSRYGKGESEQGDYINCPLTRDQYQAFLTALTTAARIPLREFESALQHGVRAGSSAFFEACLPIEIMAMRSQESLAYGPMRPVGLRNPHTNSRMHAVVQLRQDNLAASLYNMVGFQTNLTFPEQQRVFRMIPGLAQARFIRYGQMHRNTFIASPLLLHPTLQARQYSTLFYAGQITGVEGYIGNIATGWLSGVNAAHLLTGKDLITFPPSTMLGALCHYITHAEMKDFQPMKANFGLLPPLEETILGRRMRAASYRSRAEQAFSHFIASHPDLLPTQEPQ